jgi:hypothetical protein
MPLLSSGYPKGIYGIGIRDQLFPGEEEYFKTNPNVAGMAAEDDKVIINPYSKITDKEKDLVMLNEAARVHMRKGLFNKPNFELTQEQLDMPLGDGKLMKDYSKDINDIRQTITARILSGDPTAGKPTPAQIEYVNQLKNYMGVK